MLLSKTYIQITNISRLISILGVVNYVTQLLQSSSTACAVISVGLLVVWTVAGVRWCHLIVVVPQADTDGAAGPGQDSCHAVEMDEHICYSLQDELLIHYGLVTSENKKDQAKSDHLLFPSVEDWLCQWVQGRLYAL